MESIFFSLLLQRILRMHSVESNDNKAFSMEPEMDEKNSSENICVGWCRYTQWGMELNARSWDTLHHTWDKEFSHMFSAFQLDLLRRWVPWDCICIYNIGIPNPNSIDFTYFRNLSLYFRFTLYVFLAFAVQPQTVLYFMNFEMNVVFFGRTSFLTASYAHEL